MMDTIRAFIAIEMPQAVTDIVRRSQDALRRGGIKLRWVRPENVHMTLRFLGDIPVQTIADIRTALGRLAEQAPSFSLRVKGTGVFPGVARPRVVWMGVEGQIQLLEGLHRRLSVLLSEQGVPGEGRPFRGHLTIGRVKDRIDTDRLREQLSRMESIESPPFTADRICLFKSDLKPEGPVYTPLVMVRTACPGGERGGVASPKA